MAHLLCTPPPDDGQDGDASGFGSLVAYAPADALGAWAVPKNSAPQIVESPRAFSWGGDVFLIGRREIKFDYDWGQPWDSLPFEGKGGGVSF
jgi:hypothetical protein